MILVTGGAGYIGSHFVLACRDAGRDVMVIDDLSTGSSDSVPADVPFVYGDCGDPQLLTEVFSRWPVKTVVHFAARSSVPDSIRDPLEYYQVNVIASSRLISACCAHGVKNFIFSSTAAIYGQTDKAFISEDHPVAPLTPYGRTKHTVEYMLQDVARTGQIKSAILRYFNVAGADLGGRAGPSRPTAQHLIKKVCRVATGAEPFVEIFGGDYNTPDGTCIRDFIHVTDLCNAHMAALSTLESGPGNLLMNCGNERGVSVREIVTCASELLGRPLPYVIQPRRPGDMAHVVARCDRLKALGWRPRVSDLRTILGSALRFEQDICRADRPELAAVSGY